MNVIPRTICELTDAHRLSQRETDLNNGALVFNKGTAVTMFL